MVRVLFSITITVWLPSLGSPLKKNSNTLISIPSHICFLCTWTLISQLEWSIKSDLVSHNVTGLLCKGNPVKSRSSQICTYFPIIKRSSLHRNWHHLKCSWFLFTEKMTMSTLDLFARGGGLNCWPPPLTNFANFIFKVYMVHSFGHISWLCTMSLGKKGNTRPKINFSDLKSSRNSVIHKCLN